MGTEVTLEFGSLSASSKNIVRVFLYGWAY